MFPNDADHLIAVSLKLDYQLASVFCTVRLILSLLLVLHDDTYDQD